MKKILSVFVIAAFCAAFILLAPQQMQAKKTKKIIHAGKNSFAEVSKHLDPGGDYYMYMSAEKNIKFIENLLGLLKGIALEESKKPKEKQEIETGFNLVNSLLKNSGLFEISGIGSSSILMNNGFNHEKTVIHHYKGMGKGLMWNLDQGTPHAFDSQALLPANTAFAAFSDSNLPYLWDWIKKEAAASGIPKLQQGIQMIEPMLQSKGFDLKAILGSLAGKSGIIFTLDDGDICKIPVKKNFTVEFPNPALALVHYVKDDTIFNLLNKVIPIEAQVDGSTKKIVVPIPPGKVPITLSPMIVQSGNLLIISSTGGLVDDILARSGALLKGAEFKNLSVSMPDKGNSYTFWSARIFKLIQDIQQKAIEMSGEDGKKKFAAFEKFNLFPKEMAFYSVKQNTPEGFIYYSNNNLPLGGSAILPALAVGGVVAAIAIPNFLTAMQKGKQKSTMGDMKSISIAISAYITEKGHAPKGNSLQEIRSELEPFYIKRLPMKDGWGHMFHYRQGMDGKKDAYCIASGGKDGVFKGWQQKGCYVVKEVKSFNNDVIMCGGEFVFCPKVK